MHKVAQSMGSVQHTVANIQSYMFAQQRRDNVDQHVVRQVATIAQAVDQHNRNNQGAPLDTLVMV